MKKESTKGDIIFWSVIVIVGIVLFSTQQYISTHTGTVLGIILLGLTFLAIVVFTLILRSRHKKHLAEMEEKYGNNGRL